MHSKIPTLFVFSGLPGVGKSALAKHLATATHSVWIRIDTIEQALRDLCQVSVEGEGYRLAYRIATDNLCIGNNVIADCCNPISLTRSEWESVSLNAQANHINIEVVCSDPEEHEFRISSRECEIPGLSLPGWDAVQQREFQPWQGRAIRIDTAGTSVLEAFDALASKLNLLNA